MKVYKTIKKRVLIEEIDTIHCNKCGECLTYGPPINSTDYYVEFNLDFGYFSHFDGQTHVFDLCEGCYKKWIKTFKIPIKPVYRDEL